MSETLKYDILLYDILTGEASAVLREWTHNDLKCIGLVYVPIGTVPFYRWEVLKRDGSRAGSIITGPNPRDQAFQQMTSALAEGRPELEIIIRKVSDCYACGRD